MRYLNSERVISVAAFVLFILILDLAAGSLFGFYETEWQAYDVQQRNANLRMIHTPSLVYHHDYLPQVSAEGMWGSEQGKVGAYTESGHRGLPSERESCLGRLHSYSASGPVSIAFHPAAPKSTKNLFSTALIPMTGSKMYITPRLFLSCAVFLSSYGRSSWAWFCWRVWPRAALSYPPKVALFPTLLERQGFYVSPEVFWICIVS